jgi:hypothetical protein
MKTKIFADFGNFIAILIAIPLKDPSFKTKKCILDGGHFYFPPTEKDQI